MNMARIDSLLSLRNLVNIVIYVVLFTSIKSYASTPPYNEGVRNLTLLNGSSVDTVQFNTNENVTIQFVDVAQHNKTELTLENYNGSTTYLDKQDMNETDNGDGTYTYSYTFNTNTLLGGTEDWYYFYISMNAPKAYVAANFIVGTPISPHYIKTFSDSGYTTESNVFSLNDTVYVEIVGDDNGNSVSQKKMTITDYDETKYINGNIGSVSVSSSVYRFSIDLSSPNRAFSVNEWWHSLDIQIKQSGSGQESFLGYKQIKVLPVAPAGAGKWIQQRWRELE